MPTFRLTTDGLIIRPSTFEEVEAQGHPLSRPRYDVHERARLTYYVVIREQDGAIVCSLSVEQWRGTASTVSMDWATAPAEQKKRYASMSVRCLAEWLDQQPGIDRICADIVPTNEASEKTAVRAGFVRTETRGLWEWRVPNGAARREPAVQSIPVISRHAGDDRSGAADDRSSDRRVESRCYSRDGGPEAPRP